MLGGRQGKEEEDSPERATSVWPSMARGAAGEGRGGRSRPTRRRRRVRDCGGGRSWRKRALSFVGRSATRRQHRSPGENSGTLARQCGPFVRAALEPAPPPEEPLGVCPRHLPPRGAASRRASTETLSSRWPVAVSTIAPRELTGRHVRGRSTTTASSEIRARAAAGALECRPSLFMRGVPTRPADLGRRQFRPRIRIGLARARTRCSARRRRRKKILPRIVLPTSTAAITADRRARTSRSDPIRCSP